MRLFYKFPIILVFAVIFNVLACQSKKLPTNKMRKPFSLTLGDSQSNVEKSCYYIDSCTSGYRSKINCGGEDKDSIYLPVNDKGCLFKLKSFELEKINITLTPSESERLALVQSKDKTNDNDESSVEINRRKIKVSITKIKDIPEVITEGQEIQAKFKIRYQILGGKNKVIADFKKEDKADHETVDLDVSFLERCKDYQKKKDNLGDGEKNFFYALFESTQVDGNYVCEQLENKIKKGDEVSLKVLENWKELDINLRELSVSQEDRKIILHLRGDHTKITIFNNIHYLKIVNYSYSNNNKKSITILGKSDKSITIEKLELNKSAINLDLSKKAKRYMSDIKKQLIKDNIETNELVITDSIVSWKKGRFSGKELNFSSQKIDLNQEAINIACNKIDKSSRFECFLRDDCGWYGYDNCSLVSIICDSGCFEKSFIRYYKNEIPSNWGGFIDSCRTGHLLNLFPKDTPQYSKFEAEGSCYSLAYSIWYNQSLKVLANKNSKASIDLSLLPLEEKNLRIIKKLEISTISKEPLVEIIISNTENNKYKINELIINNKLKFTDTDKGSNLTLPKNIKIDNLKLENEKSDLTQEKVKKLVFFGGNQSDKNHIVKKITLIGSEIKIPWCDQYKSNNSSKCEVSIGCEWKPQTEKCLHRCGDFSEKIGCEITQECSWEDGKCVKQ